ncbi:MAG: DUF1570 domain-containing protein [Pirellulaceae bacterium]|nr:DUF1570 domain-containing protein [Pirellulaceae bacterium]
MTFVPVIARAVDHVSLERDGRPIHISGKVLVEAQDGGLLLMDSSRVLWAVTPDEITRHDKDQQEFKLLDKEGMSEQLQKELIGRFRVHKTAHYVICYNTSAAYAGWCGALFERLYRAFGTYWKNRGFELDEPKWPLVALVFDDRQSYAQYAKSELGDATSSIIGYFSLRSNRVTMYDLTGVDRIGPGRTSSAAQINRILSRPEAERTVATIIHEATHQLAFNRGLQTRYADIPLWVSEGLAIYFETPDLRSSKGWRNIGGVNRVRLNEFRRYQQSRPQNSLVTLISDDQRFRSVRTAPDAYCEAWALNYFLIRKHPKEYLKYTKLMAEKKRLLYDSPEERRQQFQEAFGEDLGRLDREFLRDIRSIR